MAILCHFPSSRILIRIMRCYKVAAGSAFSGESRWTRMTTVLWKHTWLTFGTNPSDQRNGMSFHKSSESTKSRQFPDLGINLPHTLTTLMQTTLQMRLKTHARYSTPTTWDRTSEERLFPTRRVWESTGSRSYMWPKHYTKVQRISTLLAGHLRDCLF